MLYDPLRHERLQSIPWDESLVRTTLDDIVRDCEARYEQDGYWPAHPQDVGADEADVRLTPLYHGACGVIWALHYLQRLGAVKLQRSYLGELDVLLVSNRTWLKKAFLNNEAASYLMGDTPNLMLAYGDQPSEDLAGRIASLVAGNLHHPARELMWGAPGTLLAALFMHERSGDDRWATLFRDTAAKLYTQLIWSPDYACSYWTQDLYGNHCSYLDAVHGFVATASPLIRGRHLLDRQDWAAWEACIVNTIRRSAMSEGDLANWPARLYAPEGQAPRLLVQFCHGAPGFVTCLGDLPNRELDALLIAAGEMTWVAGPLTKGSNLCHGTGGNGYAFLKLYQRTGDMLWLERARAFAMHGIAQTRADAARYGQMRYSLWTGDPGFAIYLWDCLHGKAAFPTLDVFFAA